MQFDLQPRLHSEGFTLRPLESGDFEPLWQVAADPLLWEQHPDKTRCERAGFGRFFEAALAGGALALVDRRAEVLIGSTRFYDWVPAQREVAIGYTFIARSHWGGAANREMKRLLIQYAAPFVDAIWFHVGKHNLRSRRAMERLGAEAVFERPRPLNGIPVEFVYYRIRPGVWRPG